MKRSRKAIVKLDVSEEAPLEASKVLRHYTKKKRVATLTEQCVPNPAAAGNNHVNVKEEYDPDIEAMSFNREIDNHVKIKQEDVTDTVKFDLNCTFDKANDQETIKEDEQVQRTRNDLPRRAKCSRSSENIGKLKDENKSSVSIKHQKNKEENVSDSKVTRRELLHTEIEIDIKMEPQDDESHKEKNIDGTIVETGVLQPEKNIKTIPQYKKTQHLAKSSSRKSVEINVDNINGSIDLPNTRIIYLRSAAQLAQELSIKQETDYDSETAKVLKWRITNDSASSTDKPDTNIANVMIQDSTSLANNNENPSSYTKETPVVAQAKLSGIAFAHTMNQPNSIIGNVKIQDSISLANNNENPSNNTKGVPALTQVKLKRIAFAPRPLRTYGRKQPDTVPFKKCFLVTVNNPPTDGRKLWKEKLVDLKGKEPLFMCDMCDRRFYNKAAVSQHIRNSHLVAARRHECGLPACGARFAFHFQLLAHRRAHAGAPLACDLCDLLFKSRRQYGVHLNTHLRERLFPCPICMRRYAVYEHLLTHAAKHTPADTFPCASCDASFRTVVDSARHAERDHGEKTEFPCYYCGRTLDSNAEMLAHVATRHDNRLHYCAFCPRRFDDVERFERHSAEHVQQITPILPFSKRHVCDICNKKFSFASVLKTHMATHTGARPFECGECGRRLKTRSALTEHVTAHRKPYACPQCARRFGKRGSLARHLLLHLADKPHKCTECDQEFSQRWSMMLHKKRSHAAGLLNLPKKKPKKNGKRAKDSS